MTADDLSLHRPGQAAREQALALRTEAPVRTALARILGVKTPERAWRIGADGEQRVARRLTRLDDRWRVLHAIPVGENGADIDHLVVGPGGVFTLNTKNHPSGKVWVAGDGVRVNGQRVPYVRNARHEANRAARLLAPHTGGLVVRAVVVVVGADEVTVREQPSDVHVVTGRRLVKWLNAEPVVIDHARVERVFHVARQRSVWQPS